MPDLTPFDGREVARTSIAITRAGDGLSEAMKVEPREFHHGDTVYVVLECTVTKVQFVPFDKADPAGPLSRVHTLAAGVATIVDEELVKAHIAEQADRNLRAREAEAGIVRMFDGDGEPAPTEDDGLEGEPAPDDAWEDPEPEAEPKPARGRTRKATK